MSRSHGSSLAKSLIILSNSVKFSIITPSFGQFDWLKLCIASVSDQASVSDHVGTRYERGNVKRGKVGECESNDLHAFEPSNLPTAQSPLSIEHIIQDGGDAGDRRVCP